jgi:hypothetical protein
MLEESVPCAFGDAAQLAVMKHSAASSRNRSPSLRRQVINDDVLPVRIAKITQALEKRAESVRLQRSRVGLYVALFLSPD